MKQSTLSTEEKVSRVLMVVGGSLILLIFLSLLLRFITGIHFFGVVPAIIVSIIMGFFFLTFIIYLIGLGIDLVYCGLTGKKKFDLF